MSAPLQREASPPAPNFTAQEWSAVCIAGFVTGLVISKVIDLAIGGPGLLAAFGIVS